MLTAFLDGTACVLTVCIMLAAGYWFEKKGWFHGEREDILARLVVRVGLPCTVFYGFVSNFSRADLLSLGWGLGLPLIIVLSNIALSALLVRVFHVREGRRTPFIIAFSFSNAVFIGVPVVVALFGQEALPLSMLTFMVNTSIFWTLGIALLRRESVQIHGEGDIPQDEPFYRKIVRLVQPATAMFALAIAIILIGWTPPVFLMSAVQYLGNLVTPLSLVYSGAVIGRVGLRGLKPDRDTALVLMGRFLWAPAAALLLTQFVPLPALTEKVIIMQLAMSVQTQSTIVTGLYRLDAPFVIRCFTISTLMTFAMIPLYMMLFELVF
ncbi:MAG: AEC family transporter [Christensenellales bacterium]|jgi:predicted permease